MWEVMVFAVVVELVAEGTFVEVGFGFAAKYGE
jgi:hypothetical protein